jgi:hypothetical protein
MAFHPNEGQGPEQVHADKSGAKVERAADATSLPTEKVLADIMPPKLGVDKNVAAQEERLGEGPGKFIKLANANASVMLNALTAEHAAADQRGNVQQAFWPFTSSQPSEDRTNGIKCPDGSFQQNSCDGHSGVGGRTNPAIVPRGGTTGGGVDRSTPSESEGTRGTGTGTRGGTSEGVSGEGAHGAGTAGEGAHGGFGGAHGGGAAGGHGGGAAG